MLELVLVPCCSLYVVLGEELRIKVGGEEKEIYLLEGLPVVARFRRFQRFFVLLCRFFGLDLTFS